MQHRPKPAKKNNQMNVAPQVPVQPIPPPPIQVGGVRFIETSLKTDECSNSQSLTFSLLSS